uniref:Uncharacterized protein n=1 Tax=Rhizophora mucronata TaxID=61149 RepID=A0A2P2P4L8_RHIMU
MYGLQQTKKMPIQLQDFSTGYSCHNFSQIMAVVLALNLAFENHSRLISEAC